MEACCVGPATQTRTWKNGGIIRMRNGAELARRLAPRCGRYIMLASGSGPLWLHSSSRATTACRCPCNGTPPQESHSRGGAEVRLCPRSHPREGGKRETTDCSAPTVDSAAGAPLPAWAGRLCGAIPTCRCTCNRTPPQGISLTGGGKGETLPKFSPFGGGKRETAGLPQLAGARATAPLPKEIF